MQVVEEGKVGIQGALNAKEGKGPAAVSALRSAGMQPDWLHFFTCKHGGPAVWPSHTQQWVTAGLLPSLNDLRGTLLGRCWTATGVVVTAVMQALRMLTQLDSCWMMAHKSATR